MVGVFKRSLSFPTKINPNRPSSKPLHISKHIRSISLPCRSHPLISQLKDQLTHLKTTWPAGANSICDGLSRLRDIHNSFDDILQLPQTIDSLRSEKDWIEKVLEDFLKFVDVYGIFQNLLMGMKEEHLSVQVAIRKRDYVKLALYIKARRKLSKEIGKLLSTVRCVEKNTRSRSIGEAEMVGVMSDVVKATVLVSAALFNGIASSFRKNKYRNNIGYFKCKNIKVDELLQGIEELQLVGEESLLGLKKMEGGEVKIVLKNMREIEGCICAIESGSQKVFRTLISSRVFLLNTLTHM